MIKTKKRMTETASHLLALAATSYPKYYLDQLFWFLSQEETLRGRSILASILNNILDSADESSSLCQDTGIPTFHIFFPTLAISEQDITEAFVQATQEATEAVPLRKNVIEPFSFSNSGTNTGWGTPFVHFHHAPHAQHILLRAELKGFGGEIKSHADWVFTSTESMEEAVLAYALNSAILSRGENCIPGFIGIGVGGYLSEAMTRAKDAVFRELNGPFSHPDLLLSQLEKRILGCINALGLGPMGKGGKTSALGVYLERQGTHTAAAPIAVSHQCWASRASEAIVHDEAVHYITPHLQKHEITGYREKLELMLPPAKGGEPVHRLRLPQDFERIKRLRIGEIVYLDGIVCTARDRAHQKMAALVRDGQEGEIPQEIREHGIIYHCGPVVSPLDSGWRIAAAGPTTSSRFTGDASELIRKGIIKISIGKGTMGPLAQEAMQGRGVYLNAVGGCAVTYKNMLECLDVKWLELGYPEAVWIFQVHDFGPLVVAIDAHGNSLMEDALKNVHHNALDIYEKEHLDPDKRYIQYPLTFAGLSLNEVLELNASSFHSKRKS